MGENLWGESRVSSNEGEFFWCQHPLDQAERLSEDTHSGPSPGISPTKKMLPRNLGHRRSRPVVGEDRGAVLAP